MAAGQQKKPLSISSIKCFQRCPKMWEWRYVKGLKKEAQTDAQKQGTALHGALDKLLLGESFGIVLAEIGKYYEDEYDVALNAAIIKAYHEFYKGGDPFEYHQAEKDVCVQLEADWRGKKLRGPWDLRAILDKVMSSAGRGFIMDHKVVSQDISPGSDYRVKLVTEPQFSMYTLVARELGVEVRVICDMIRKPGIKPKKLTLAQLREAVKTSSIDGCEQSRDRVKAFKEYLDARDAAQKAKAKLPKADFPEDNNQFFCRVLETIKEDPGKHFQRQEVVRTDRDLNEFATNTIAVMDDIKRCLRRGFFPRNHASCHTPYKCDYIGPCLSYQEDLTEVPDGFTLREEGGQHRDD